MKRFNKKLFIEGFRGGLYFSKKHYGPIAYQVYRAILTFSMLLAVAFSALFYPFLKNKEKLSAFIAILLLSLKGEILSPYERS